MAEDTGKTILLIGVLGAGAYLVFEYTQYTGAINTATGGDATQTATVEQQLPFFTWLSMKWGGTGTTQQQQLYQALLNPSGGLNTQTPGTTGTNQTTTISTAPPTTNTVSGSSAPMTVVQRLPISAAPRGSSLPATALAARAAAAKTIAKTAGTLTPVRR